MDIRKILLVTLLFASTSQAQSYFTTHHDMCESTEVYSCPNKYNSIRNLQIALNRDSNMSANLRADGNWGEITKQAVITFQKKYELSHTDGWVGKETKEKLDLISLNKTFPKDVALENIPNRNKSMKKVRLVSKTKCNKSVVCNSGSYAAFKRSTNLRRSFKVFKDKKLLSRANSRNTKLKIDISEQRVKLYVNGKVALCSPCTTGAKRKFEPNTRIYRDKRTPKGSFRITEKIADKRSNIFGKFYRGNRVVYTGDRRKFKGSGKYVGASLKNWMRITGSGIGLHASKYVKRNPGTNGCIRLPYSVSKTIFKNVRAGTKVSIVN
ncbi:MAG: L,D-transpeptidase family protein [Sulfurovum sp.]